MSGVAARVGRRGSEAMEENINKHKRRGKNMTRSFRQTERGKLLMRVLCCFWLIVLLLLAEQLDSEWMSAPKRRMIYTYFKGGLKVFQGASRNEETRITQFVSLLHICESRRHIHTFSTRLERAQGCLVCAAHRKATTKAYQNTPAASNGREKWKFHSVAQKKRKT